MSSLARARTRETLHNGWDKNDLKDAQVILHMLKIGATHENHDPICAGINDILELTKTHSVISRAKIELWHRLLTQDMTLYFLEIACSASNSRSDWLLAFLERFPAPASITRCRRRRLSTPPGLWSAGRSQDSVLWAIFTRRRGVQSSCQCRPIASP